MYVNPFAFGVVVALAALFLMLVIQSFITSILHPKDDDDMTEEEYKEMLEELTGKKFKITTKNGFLVGEPIEDDDDDNSNKKTD